MHKQKTRKLLSFLLMLALLIPLWQGIMPERVAEAATVLTNPRTDSDGVTTWDCVYFGKYWQEDTNGDGKADKNDAKTPIKWRVLSVDGDDAFLLADKNLDGQKYNDTRTDVTWETCTMRSWLNGYGAGSNVCGKDYTSDNFLDNAFSTDEQSAIKNTNVVNDDNREYGTKGGDSTSDKVYLLSIGETENSHFGFSSNYSKNDKNRGAKNTEYAKAQGVWTNASDECTGNGDWWLRSSGYGSYYASFVSQDGYVIQRGYKVHDMPRAVRPVLHLNLSSCSNWSYAGTVTSEEGETEIVLPTDAPGEVTGKLNNPMTDADEIVTWDCIWFGNYWQEDTNGDGTADKNDAKTPIKWRVLSVDGDDAFLVADKNLDSQKYNDTNTDVTWETCTMRSWLNGYGADANQEGKDCSDNNFLNNAFSKSEQSAIRTTNIVNDDNREYGIERGKDTSDKVYLLSISEATNPDYGFSSDVSKLDKSRGTKTTKYAKAQGVKILYISGEYARNGAWCLRSSGQDSSGMPIVNNMGFVFEVGASVAETYAVRPVLHLNLSSASNWLYAGTVTSEGKVEEKGIARPTVTPGVTKKPGITLVPTPGEVTGKLKKPATDIEGTVTWDCVYFGNYWQEDTNGDGKTDENDTKIPIKWRVLSVDGDDAFLVSDKGLDAQQYNSTETNVTWETCTMRSWLNGYGVEVNKDGKDYESNNFLSNAFSKSEQLAIKATKVVNDDNPEYGTEGGKSTLDKVYLLSISEATNSDYGFLPVYSENDKGRRAKNTEYATQKGAGTTISDGYAGNGSWWLRSPGNLSGWSVSDVSYYGDVDQYGDYVLHNKAVRPVLHLNLSVRSSWSYAGTVNSEGKVEEPEETSQPSVPPTAAPRGTEKPSTPPTATPGAILETPPTPTPTLKPPTSVPPMVTPEEFTGKLKNPTKNANGTVTWDCVYFGNYWQEDTNGDGCVLAEVDTKIPIKWRVLSVDGDDAFLVADKNLDCQKYNNTRTDTTWETCTLRSWLNGYAPGANQEGKDYSNYNFIDNAFSKSEQAAIEDTYVINDDSPSGTSGGNNTLDKVYLLSVDEIKNLDYGFLSNECRRAKNTEYAKQRAWTSTKEEYAGNGYWWLRSPGSASCYASYVHAEDWIADGYDVDSWTIAVRPALHLNLSDTSNWTYAGTVTSESKADKPGVTPPVVTSEPTEKPGTTPTPKPPTSVPPTVVPGEVTGELRNPTTNADGIVTWDCVYFGNYWQEDTNGDGKADKNDAKQPIKWRVLSVNGDDAFLVVDKNLDCQRYNETDTSVTWETCTMRSWLNGYGAEKNKGGKDYGSNNFLRNAFSETEQAAIKITNVVNNDNPEYGTEGGNDTSDKVYLLSLDEVTNSAYGFSGSSYDLRRAAKTTEYAKAQGVWADDPLDVYIDDGCWWLRSPGENSDDASYVGVDGSVNSYDVCGNDFYGNEYAARPALHLNLKAASDDVSSVVWSYAGTVTVEGEVEEPEETDKPSAPIPTPGKPSQPVTSSVTPFAPQLGSPVVPGSGVSPAPGRNTVGKVTTLKSKQKKRTVTLSWKKQTGVKGYQICYSTFKKWKGKKQKLVTKNNAVIKNLKKGKTYYFRVRAYRQMGTKKVFGAWSGVKKIRIKK